MASVPAPRIVVRVAPRVLSDVLTLALHERGLRAVAVEECDTDQELLGDAELAIVTDELPTDVAFDTVLVLDRAGETVTLDGQPHDLAAADGGGLERLVDLVCDLSVDRD